MRAAVLPAHGAVPEPGTFDDPVAGEGQELVTVEAGGLNPVDLRIAGGNFPRDPREPPYVPGKEGVGALEDGARVYFDENVAPFGAYAERTLIPAGSGFAVPEGLDAGLALALGVAGLAAWLGLEWRGELKAGETRARAGRQRRGRPDRRAGRAAARGRAASWPPRAARRGWSGPARPAPTPRSGSGSTTTWRRRCARPPAAAWT